MRIFLYVTGILVLLLVPFFVKTHTVNKMVISFLLGFAAICFLIDIEFFSPPPAYTHKEDALIYFVNWVAYGIFGLICLLYLLIKAGSRKEYFFFFPAIATCVVFTFTSFSGVKYSSIMTGNILLVFLPAYIHIYYLKYRTKKLQP